MEFKEWLVKEESHGDRTVRDVRALSRHLDTLNHERNRPRTPKGLSPKELVSWAVKNGDRIRLPMSTFIDRVEEEISRKLKSMGKPDVHTLFYGPEMAGISARSTADYERLRDILQDSYMDGTTVDQAVEMGMEFVRSRGLTESTEILEYEVYVDKDGYAHDDEGNREYVGRRYHGQYMGASSVRKSGMFDDLSAPKHEPTRADPNPKQVEALKKAITIRPNEFLGSILFQVQQGRILSDAQKKAVRQNFYKIRMKEEADLFR